VLLAQLLRQRVWQAPLLAMFSVTFIGTLVMNILALLVLNLLGTPLEFSDSLGLVVLPSMLLNLLIAIPVYVIVRDLAQWISPMQELE
jgi:biotin transporter BioY